MLCLSGFGPRVCEMDPCTLLFACLALLAVLVVCYITMLAQLLTMYISLRPLVSYMHLYLLGQYLDK